ncbi:Golgi transport complex subunit 4 [Phytophthora pseudosyringae]|uniref:Golgi transport complex subunit 4 n=1 Tax=Phytophthora pseudosyringae TaxID=221518 RepID=A0A8T1VK83_9STRA|nr:Golgi transport complex subunit 4 [Phytophthora pseudosyringae]
MMLRFFCWIRCLNSCLQPITRHGIFTPTCRFFAQKIFVAVLYAADVVDSIPVHVVKMRLLGCAGYSRRLECDDSLEQQDGDGGFQTKVQELSSVYVLLERFYMFQSAHKTTVIAEPSNPQQLEHGVYMCRVVRAE